MSLSHQYIYSLFCPHNQRPNDNNVASTILWTGTIIKSLTLYQHVVYVPTWKVGGPEGAFNAWWLLHVMEFLGIK